jgi:hypothetical protein
MGGVFTIMNFWQKKYNKGAFHFKEHYHLIQTEKNIDAILIGSSHMTHAIRPTSLDSVNTFYNFALNGGGPEFYYKWYTDYYKKYQKAPSYCIIGVDWFMFDGDWLMRRLEHDSEFIEFNQFRHMLSRGYNKKNLVVNRMPFIKYRKDIGTTLLFKNGHPEYPESSYDRGYINYTYPYDSTIFHPQKTETIDPLQIEYFELLIQEFQRDQVKMIFVMCPEYGLSKEFYNGKKALNTIQSIANDYNIHFLNYNGEYRSYINNERRYFTDWGHLNHRGSEEFTKQLSKTLHLLQRD